MQRSFLLALCGVIPFAFVISSLTFTFPIVHDSRGVDPALVSIEGLAKSASGLFAKLGREKDNVGKEQDAVQSNISTARHRHAIAREAASERHNRHVFQPTEKSRSRGKQNAVQTNSGTGQRRHAGGHDGPIQADIERDASILFISAIFGSVSPHMRLFLKSVAHKSFDVLLFGNVRPIGQLSSNVRWLNMSWTELQERVKAAAPQCFLPGMDGFPEETARNYRKINDIKPMFGEILADEISSYRFWGYGDNDVWVGDLSKWLQGPRTMMFDTINLASTGMSPRFAWGPGTFFKNERRVNRLYRRNRELCDMLSSTKMYIFDEAGRKGGGVSMHGIISGARRDRKVRLRPWLGFDEASVHWDGHDFLRAPASVNVTCEMHCERDQPCRVYKHCWPKDSGKCARREVALCHHQYGKGRMNVELGLMSEAELRRVEEAEHLFWRDGRGLWVPSESELEELRERGIEAQGPVAKAPNPEGHPFWYLATHRWEAAEAAEARAGPRGKPRWHAAELAPDSDGEDRTASGSGDNLKAQWRQPEHRRDSEDTGSDGDGRSWRSGRGRSRGAKEREGKPSKL